MDERHMPTARMSGPRHLNPEADVEDTAPRPAVSVRDDNAAGGAPSMPDAVYNPAPPAQPREPRTTRPARTRKPAKHGCLSFLLWIVLLVVAGFMALRCLPASMANGRAVPELASFVPLMIFPLVPMVILAIAWRRRVLAVLSIAALVAMGVWHYGYFVPTARDPKCQDGRRRQCLDRGLRRAHHDPQHQERHGRCRPDRADLPRAERRGPVPAGDRGHPGGRPRGRGDRRSSPYHVISDGAAAVNNGGRNGIWTATPMSDVSTNLVSIATSAMPAATITVGQTQVRVVSVHPNSPVRGAQGLWSAGLDSIQTLGGYSHNYLLMGDFNSTWDHERFRALLGTAFVDAGEQAGEGFHMTYPANSPIPALIEIDHIVYSRGAGIAVSELQTVEVAGSDHLALLATLETR